MRREPEELLALPAPMDDGPLARRRWRRIYFATVIYGVATLVALWAFARAFTF